jgi:Domain of unknown function (DUF3576)
MSAPYYRPLIVVAASLSLSLAACGWSQPKGDAAATTKQTASTGDDGLDTDATIWTMLGLAKERPQRRIGPQTGAQVSPILYQAVHDTLNFVRMSSDDPLTGALVTDWYSPKSKPDERFRITVFILSRALRSDSVAVTVDRQVRKSDGEWVASTVDRQVVSNLENDILQRAQQIRAARAGIY